MRHRRRWRWLHSLKRWRINKVSRQKARVWPSHPYVCLSLCLSLLKVTCRGTRGSSQLKKNHRGPFSLHIIDLRGQEVPQIGRTCEGRRPNPRFSEIIYRNASSLFVSWGMFYKTMSCSAVQPALPHIDPSLPHVCHSLGWPERAL